jgi:ribonuclease E
VEPDLVIRVVRDLFSKEYDRLAIEGRDAYERVVSYMRAVAPELLEKVSLHEGEEGIFDAENVTDQLRKALERKIWLPSGGQIVIDRAEALTVIDVNTARFVGKTSLEDTVVRNNLEAAAEIVRQLRLRDIGGIVIIDFVDMLLVRNREQVLREFKLELERDKTKTQVIGISPLGLVEMTRKNVSEGLLEALSSPCPTCAGRGVVLETALAQLAPDDGAEDARPRARPRRRSRSGRGGRGGPSPSREPESPDPPPDVPSEPAQEPSTAPATGQDG